MCIRYVCIVVTLDSVTTMVSSFTLSEGNICCCCDDMMNVTILQYSLLSVLWYLSNQNVDSCYEPLCVGTGVRQR